MRNAISPRNRFPLLALACSAVFACPDARAQAAKGDGLEEIIVTAKRRVEDIQTASLSAKVLNQDLLENKGVVDLYALQYAAPAVTVTQYGSANVFNIRGLGRSQVDIDVPSGVVIYRDGTPTLAGYFQNEPYFDMESVEVYRGPQGTFVGKNAAGGAVFINTNDPRLDEFDGSVEVGAGDYEWLEATGIVNIPMGDTAALRLGYRHAERDHFYDAIIGDYTGNPGEVDNNSYRLGLLWQPSDSFSGMLKIDYHDLDFGGNPTTVFGEEPLGVVEQYANFAYTDESTRAVLDLKYTFANGITLSSLTGYQDIESVNNLDLNATVSPPTPTNIYIFNSRIDAEFWSQEFNLVSPDDQAFTWALGLFWQSQDSEIPSWEEGGFNFIGGPFYPNLAFPWFTSPWDNEEEDRAVFAHGRYKLTDQVELEAGVRYSEYERDQFTNFEFGFGNTPPFIPFATPGGDRQSIEEDDVDWQVALNWEASAMHYLYGLISSGHVSGGINIFPIAVNGVQTFLEYDPMEVINYEAGWKARLADDQFHTQLSVYYETFDDYQANFSEFNSSVPGLNNPTLRNAETESTVWGIEFSGQARFGNFALDFGLAYMETELGTFSDVRDPFRFVDNENNTTGEPIPDGIGDDNNGDGVPDDVVNLSGAHVPFSPEFTGNIGMAYDIEFGDYTLTPRVDFSHQDETQAALWPDPQVTLEERDLINAQLTFGPDSGTWSAVLWGTNITDEHYVSGIQNNGSLYYAAPPRQYGLRVKFNFGQ
jgi:iron complex outermembrane receptor protein